MKTKLKTPHVRPQVAVSDWYFLNLDENTFYKHGKTNSKLYTAYGLRLNTLSVFILYATRYARRYVRLKTPTVFILHTFRYKTQITIQKAVQILQSEK